MGDMHIGHQKVLGADGGRPTALYRRAIDRDIFPKNVVIADDDLGRFALIAEMLGRAADRDKGMQFAPRTDLRPAIDCDMRNNPRSRSDRDMFANHTKRPDDHIIGQLCLGMNDRSCMNLHS